MRELPNDLIVAARQRHGVVTAEELEARGFDRSRLSRWARAGLLVRVTARTYAVPSLTGPLTLPAAVLTRHPSFVLVRRLAALVWRLDGFTQWRWGDDVFGDVVDAGPGRCRSVAVRRGSIAPGDVTERSGLRVTSAGRTLLDLGTAPGVMVDHLELAVESTLRLGHVTVDDLRLRADAAGPAGAALREVLGRRPVGAPPTESYAETRFLQAVVRPLGIDEPERQVNVFVEGRPEPYRVDFLFRRPLGALAVEVDGERWHGAASTRDDHVRDHLLRIAHVPTLRIEAQRIERKAGTARAALKRELALLEASEWSVRA